MRTGDIAIGAAAAATAAGASVAIPWPDIFKGVLGAGGVPPALFLLVVGGLCVGLVAVTMALRKSEDAREQERKAAVEAAALITELRLKESREMLLALERTATALTTHTVALEARTQVFSSVVEGVGSLAINQDATRKYFEGVANRLESGITETLKQVNEVLRLQPLRG